MSVPAAHRIIATAGGIAGAVLAAAGQPARAALAVLAGVAVGVVAVDLRERRVPTPLVTIGTIAAAVVGAITSARDESGRRSHTAPGASSW
jgi:hypothetical protein